MRHIQTYLAWDKKKNQDFLFIDPPIHKLWAGWGVLIEEEDLSCTVSANTGKDENAVSGDMGGNAFTMRVDCHLYSPRQTIEVTKNLCQSNQFTFPNYVVLYIWRVNLPQFQQAIFRKIDIISKFRIVASPFWFLCSYSEYHLKVKSH